MRQEKKNLRLFFAIDIPEVIKRNVSDLIRSLQTKYQKAPIRWVNVNHLHVTLQFLESVKIEDVPKLMEQARIELKDKRSVHIKLEEIELFPNAYKPRVISLKVEPHLVLATLAKHLGLAITKVGYPIEKRPFRGHLTLGRIKEMRKPLMLESYSLPPIPSFRANTVTLYQSEPTAEGSHYYPLDRIALPN